MIHTRLELQVCVLENGLDWDIKDGIVSTGQMLDLGRDIITQIGNVGKMRC